MYVQLISGRSWFFSHALSGFLNDNVGDFTFMYIRCTCKNSESLLYFWAEIKALWKEKIVKIQIMKLQLVIRLSFFFFKKFSHFWERLVTTWLVTTIQESTKICVQKLCGFFRSHDWFYISLGKATHGLQSINVIPWNTESLISINGKQLLEAVKWKAWDERI